MRKRRIVTTIILLVLMLQLAGCTESKNETVVPDTIQTLTFSNSMEEDEYTVMIKEYNEFVPYLVLTDDYDGSGNCLLLRKHLQDDYYIYNENVRDAGYYGNSEIDWFLNTDVYESYSNELQELILSINLEVTTKDSLEAAERNTRTIERKIFLLSNTEVGYYSDRSRLEEGEWIKYFDCGERRQATKENGEAGSWWLRTPNTGYENVVLGVSVDGISCSSGIVVLADIWKDGVRPAFCLPRDTKIIQVDGVNYIEADYLSLDVMNNAEDRTGLLYDEILELEEIEDNNMKLEECRPEDYNTYISDALAYVMENNKHIEDYKYHVFIDSIYEIDWQGMLFEINNNDENDIFMEMQYWKCLDNSHRLGSYYYVFTAEEINALAQYKIECFYVGSGEGSLDNANWDTTEGILEYCELYGDGYVAK